jgi:hypothetical protein
MGLNAKVVTCCAGGLVAVAAFVAVMTASAQHAGVADARANGIASLYLYSLVWHVVAMVAVACLAVAVAVTLWRSASRVMAGVIVVGAAAGPMAVVAAPIRPALMAPTSMDTVWWWHVVVSAALTVLLGAWVLALHALTRRDAVERSPLPAGRWDASVFVVAAALAFSLAWNHSWQLQESPGALPAFGWAVLAAGMFLAARRVGQWRAVCMVALAALALLALSHAYTRPGGWPGVAGWEMGGMESPVVLSARVEVVVVAAGALGMLAAAGRTMLARTAQTLRRRRTA